MPTTSRWRIEVVDYDAAWPVLFGQTGRALRAATDAKNPYVWEVIRRADDWAQRQGWAPGPSDA